MAPPLPESNSRKFLDARFLSLPPSARCRPHQCSPTKCREVYARHRGVVQPPIKQTPTDCTTVRQRHNKAGLQTSHYPTNRPTARPRYTARHCPTVPRVADYLRPTVDLKGFWPWETEATRKVPFKIDEAQRAVKYMINGSYPGPTLRANEDDMLEITVRLLEIKCISSPHTTSCRISRHANCR